MSYDMTVLDLPHEVRQADERLRHDRSEEALDAWRRVSTPYMFRLNILGMGFVRARMLELGMAYRSALEGGWPEMPEGYPSYSKDRFEIFDRLREQWQGAHPEEWAAYEEAVDHARRWRKPTCRAIAVHKFESNDGWIVTPAEINEALDVWDRTENRQLPDTDDVYRGTWEAWIDWLRRSATLGGFEVI